MTAAEEALQRILDLEQLKQLKARYLLYVDAKDWDAWRDLFTADVRVEGTRQSANLSRDEFVAGVRDSLAAVRTMHQATSPILESTGPDTARGIWAMHDDYLFPDGHPWAEGYRHRIGYGHYEEEYRREAGTWRISFMRLTRLWVWRADLGPLVAGWIPSAGRAWLEGPAPPPE